MRPAGTQGVPARAIVYELIVALFSSYSDLLRWVAFHFADGSRVVTLLPSPGEADGAPVTGWAERAGEAVRVLVANGFVDLEFFEQLAANFPRRRADIDRALERWTIAIASHDDAELGRL